MKRVLGFVICLCLLISLGGFAAVSAQEETADASALLLENADWVLSDDGSYYSLKNVYYCTNIVNDTYQYMNIYVPAAYLEDGEVNGYTARTAPVILENGCMGWNSSTPGNANATYLNEGFVYISVGARSRNAENGTGKAPAPVVDQKAAVRFLRLNDEGIPGDKDRIISLGSSGGGQMSSILGASGNMDEYYPYLYEIGAAGVELEGDAYISTIDDNIFASMCYCPIVDLENADLAYAWMRFDAGETSAATMFSGTIEFSEFQMALQNDLAIAFCEYINSLGLVNEDGEALSFDEGPDGTLDPRSGSYYEQVLQNISDALNAYVAAGGELSAQNTDAWVQQNEDGTYTVTDLAGFLNGTGLKRNKNIPGFDTFFATEEGNAFGTPEEGGVHFSASVAAVLEKNYDRYKEMEGFAEQDVDAYIAGASREDVREQTYLMNATAIMLNVAKGEEESDISQYWRTRNGTADEHTSFTIAYNLCLSALAAGAQDVDYGLVWNMTHGSNEGNSTGNFIAWVHRICGNDAAYQAALENPPAEEGGSGGGGSPEGESPEGESPEGESADGESPEGESPSGEETAEEAELSDGGWPLSGSGDTSMEAFKTYLKAYMDCVPEMDGHEEELYGLIDSENWEAPVAMAWEGWFEENAMTYDEFVAANGAYDLHLFGMTNPPSGDPS